MVTENQMNQEISVSKFEPNISCQRLLLLSGSLAKVNKPKKNNLISHKHKLIP